jgi:hypothetical protein
MLLACTSILSMSLTSSKLKTFTSDCPKREKAHWKVVSHSEILISIYVEGIIVHTPA